MVLVAPAPTSGRRPSTRRRSAGTNTRSSPGSIALPPGGAISRQGGGAVRTSRASCSKAALLIREAAALRGRSTPDAPSLAARARPTSLDTSRADADCGVWRGARTSDARRADGRVRRSIAARRESPSCACWVDRERARFGAWYEMFPRSAGTDPRPQRRRSAKRRAAAAHRRSMGFDVALPAADSSDRHELPERAEQRARAADRRSRQPVGDRIGGGRPHGGRARARHARGLRPLRRSGASASASRSRSTSRCSARPIIRRCASTPSGSGIGPTARSSTPRIRRRSTRTSTRSISSATTGAALWHALLRRRRCSGSSTACGSSASTTRTPSRSASGSGLIDEVHARASRTSIFLSEAFTRPKVMRYLAKVGFTQSYTLLHLAEHEGGADRLLHRADARPSAASTCGRICSRTRPTSCTSTCSTAAGRRSRRGWCSPRRSAPSTASTAASSCARTCRSGRAREEYLDSEKYQIRTRDWDRPGNIGELIAPRQRDPPAAPGAAVRPRRSRFHATDNPEIIAYSKTRARRRRPRAGDRQPRSASHAARPRAAAAGRSAAGARCRRRARSARRRGYALARRVELRAARSRRPQAHILTYELPIGARRTDAARD